MTIQPVHRPRADGAPSGDLEVHPVTADRWDDMVYLFERPGPRGGIPIVGHCWCLGDRGIKVPVREMRKAAMHDLVAQDRRPGLLAYLDGTPIGWAAVAPRDELAGLQRSRQYGPEPGDVDVFAITCFYVDPHFRGAGIATALLDAAIEFAQSRGATAVDATPKVELAHHARDGGRAEEAFSFRGRPQSFERRDFVPVRMGPARALVRKQLGTTPEGEL